MSFYKEVPGRQTTLESTLKFDTAPTKGSTNPVTSDGVKSAIDGAVFWHALYPSGKYPISGPEGYQRLVVKDCTIKANRNNTVVMESGSSTDEDCEVTMIGNACYSETNGRTWVLKAGMSPMPISSGNNVEGMNFV